MAAKHLKITLDEGASGSSDIAIFEQEQTVDKDSDEDIKLSQDTKKSRKNYNQNFRSSWKNLPEFRGWLDEGNTLNTAFCTLCNKELRAGKSELQKHAASGKHQKFAAQMSRKKINSDVPCELPDVDESELSHSIRLVDLRSDTVTQPTRPMKTAMFSASIGDDAFHEDPTVNELERKVADLLEKEAALYVPTGTMANLICVLTHCWGRGSEIVIGDQSHLHVWAQGGIAQVGNVYHRTIKNLPDGTFSLVDLRTLIRGDDPHWPVTSLICVENTHNMMGGKALPLQWLDKLAELCREFNLPIHMDGARLMNAAVAIGAPPSRIVASCDSVTLCLNKGLGAPMGSVIVGSRDFITRAVRLRKVLGGSIHQGGIMAAAGIYALDNIVPQLSLDHSHARAIAKCVSDEHSSAITVDMKDVQTNIVLLQCDNIRVNPKSLCQRLQTIPDTEADGLGEKIIVMMIPVSDSVVRFMTHYDIKKDDVAAVEKKLRYIIQEYDNMMYLDYNINV